MDPFFFMLLVIVVDVKIHSELYNREGHFQSNQKKKNKLVK